MDCLYHAYVKLCHYDDCGVWRSFYREPAAELFRQLRVATSGQGGTYVGASLFVVETLEAATSPFENRYNFQLYYASWNSLEWLLKGCENDLARAVTRASWWRAKMGFETLSHDKTNIIMDLATNHAFCGRLNDAVFPQAVIELVGL